MRYHLENMVHFYFRVCFFVAGVLLGSLLTVQYYDKPRKPNVKTFYQDQYEVFFKKQMLRRKPLLWDTMRYSNSNVLRESEFLFNKSSVLCVILVHNYKSAEAAVNTWARGCNSISLVHMDAKTKKSLPVKRVKEKSPWMYLCNTLRVISHDFDWVLIVNDNTFAIVENLRYLVAPLNPSNAYYLGHAVQFWSTIYNSKEAGYVLSKGTLLAFKQKLSKTNCTTNIYWNKEDLYLGRFLSSLNITPIDTRDFEGMSRFHPYNLYQAFFPGENSYKTSYFPTKCCSKHSITFQAIESDKMYLYHYLLYKLQLFMDGSLGNNSPVKDVPDDMVWKTFLKERNIHDFNISSEEYYKVWEALIDEPSSFAAQMKKETHFDYD